MIVVRECLRVDVEASEGAIWIKQLNGPDDEDLIRIFPIHVEAICEALRAAAKEAEKQEFFYE